MLSLASRRIGAIATIALFTISARSQGVITTPRTPSPAATVSQTIGISTVTIQYSRPSVKGREIWGKLVPYGWNKQGFGNGLDAPWRAGANENTTITLSHDGKIQGHNVPAGTYGLFFVINADNSGEVILSKDSKAWGSFWYVAANDLFREKITVKDASPREMLTYDFNNLTKTSADLVLDWEKKEFPVKIEFAVDDIVMANAQQQLTNTVGFSWMGYNSAANYALQNNVNLEQAIKWSDLAVAANPSFATMSTKSGLLKASGKTAEADKIMTDALNVATENELNTYGYTLLQQNQQDKAIAAFVLNTQKHPKSANAWDSLGEGYALKGDKQNAIQSFKKSLSLNPAAPVKANSEKYMKQLGAM